MLLLVPGLLLFRLHACRYLGQEKTVGAASRVDAVDRHDVFGGGPEDPIADAIVAAFSAAFSTACEAAIIAVGVFTEEACDEAIEKNLGLSC